MNDFTYKRVQSLPELLGELTSASGARVIAGGTNILDLMKENTVRADRILDINRLPFREIESRADGGLRLGALATNSDTADHAEVKSRYPLISQAILAGASPQLRNMATNGGNLLQRTRCYYFYDAATPCNKRSPGSGCGALHGLNRIHAILGASETCIAVHPSDFCVALAALEAVVEVEGPRGKRTIPFADFHRLPGDHPEIDTSLGEDEIITAIDLPAEGYAEHSAYVKSRERNSYAFALASAAAAFKLKGDRIESARLALGGVAHKPWRRVEAEESLVGREPTRENFAEAARIAVEGARGYGGNDYKISLVQRVAVRAFEDALANVARSGGLQ